MARLEAPYTRTRSAFDERRIDSDTSVGRLDVAIVIGWFREPGFDDGLTTRERFAATVAEHVPGEDDRRWVEPALLTLLGLEPAPAGGRDSSSPPGGSSSSGSLPRARPFSSSKTSSGPTVASSTSSSTSSSGRLLARRGSDGSGNGPGVRELGRGSAHGPEARPGLAHAPLGVIAPSRRMGGAPGDRGLLCPGELTAI